MVKRIKTAAHGSADPPSVVPDLLKSDSSVCRAHAQLDVLPHVAQLIDSFAASISDEYSLEHVSMFLPQWRRLMGRIKAKEGTDVGHHFASND